MLTPRSLRLLLALAVALLPFSAGAAGSPAQAALKRFADGIKTFSAHFEQIQTDDHGQVTARSSGQFWLERPGGASATGKFRWEYEQPYEQLTVCDGDKLWAYDPDLSQATVRNAHQALVGTPAALLSQKAALGEHFTVQDAGSDGTLRVVRLIPKSKESDFKSIELALDDTGAPVRMRFADQIGGHSEVQFTDIKANQPIEASRFAFVPPKGTEIVDGDAAPTPGAGPGAQ